MNKCYIIGGPNGAGKTTFAQTFLPTEAECLNFLNADLIAAGLSPFDPNRAKLEAGRLLLNRIDECVINGNSFAFESTLSGKSYRNKIQRWRSIGYEVVLYYLKLESVEIAIDRVKQRVSEGGHNIPEADIRRRFYRSWNNFLEIYMPIVDASVVFDTSGEVPKLLQLD